MVDYPTNQPAGRPTVPSAQQFTANTNLSRSYLQVLPSTLLLAIQVTATAAFAVVVELVAVVEMLAVTIAFVVYSLVHSNK